MQIYFPAYQKSFVGYLNFSLNTQIFVEYSNFNFATNKQPYSSLNYYVVRSFKVFWHIHYHPEGGLCL